MNYVSRSWSPYAKYLQIVSESALYLDTDQIKILLKNHQNPFPHILNTRKYNRSFCFDLHPLRYNGVFLHKVLRDLKAFIRLFEDHPFESYRTMLAGYCATKRICNELS